MNFRRVRALVLKYIFVCSRNSFRAMDVVFWPAMDLIVWGFLTMYMLRVNSAVPSLVTFLIGAIIMWNVLYRAQQVLSLSFLEDVWSRNMLNIFAAPIRISEFIAAGCFLGLMQAVIVVAMLSVLSIFMYSYNLFSLGFGLGLLFANLMLMGWALGLVSTGCILRWGPPAEVLAWAVPFLIQPLCAVFYPVNVLPPWLQPLALSVPASYVFEGMRAIVAGHPEQQWYYIGMAFALNAMYMVIASLIFRFFFNQARENGMLAKYSS
ncbi:MAG: ABC transporter permease [Candidatus Obscuribacterales bacterium]|nr:ABC transporter permease [Candidatus Obscuribacterales bacterium]